MELLLLLLQTTQIIQAYFQKENKALAFIACKINVQHFLEEETC